MKGLFAILALFISLSVGAQTPTEQDSIEFFSRIWSPYCKGVSLLECPSSQAEDLRKEIRTRVQAGEKPEVIFNEINLKHDNKLRMEPGRQGRESLAYWIPWIVFFIGGIFVVLFWKARRKKTSVPPKAPRAPAAQNQKILDDLKDRL